MDRRDIPVFQWRIKEGEGVAVFISLHHHDTIVF